jgi:hypothetical protein
MDVEKRLLELETRLEALEGWKATLTGQESPISVPEFVATTHIEETVRPAPAVAASDERVEPEVVQPPQIDFDIALVGRLLIVLGGAFLLRAVTESGVLSPTLGVSVGLAYALTWLVVALRPSVSRTSAAYHGLAAILAAYPLIFEATRKFDVLGAWSSALTLAMVTAIWALLAWRKMLNGLAWVATLGAMGTVVLLMAETSSIVPFIWVLIALGVTTLWMGYRLKWHLLRWPVAVFLDLALLFMAFLVVTDRIAIEPVPAMAAGAGAFAAYLTSFVVRNLIRERSIVLFEIVQGIGALVCGLGGAMWIAGAKDTLEMPFALAILALAAASYGASFVFIPRHFTSPGNFFFYSTFALVLVLGAGTFIAGGLKGSVLWSVLALTSAYFAGRYEKPVLAVHCAIYLVAGLVGAKLVQSGLKILALDPGGDWSVSWIGATLILGASVFAAGIHPIARKGNYGIWAFAKVTILLVFTWTGATLVMAILGGAIHGASPDAGMIAFERTAILSGLTILAAFVARYAPLSPGKRLANILMIVLAMKLLWDDLRVGTPVTMFLSFASVGIAMILATKLRKSAVTVGEVTPGTA